MTTYVRETSRSHAQPPQRRPQATGFGNAPPGGIQEFAPTVMAAVPKIWDILKKGVEDAVGKGSGVKMAVFQAAFSAR